MMQPISEADHIYRTLQVGFDRTLCNILDQYRTVSGFALLLGGLLQFIITGIKQPHIYPSEMVAYWCLVRRRGEGYILDDIGFHGLVTDILQFLTYLTRLLENPERGRTHIFDQQRYTTATKECLQLCLCNYRHFSKGAIDSGHHDRALRRNKPTAWRARIDSRIWKARDHFKDQLVSSMYIDQDTSFPDNSPEHEFYQFWSYQWALDLLPFLLEKSAISLELVEVLRRRPFTAMAQRFPQSKRLAKEAIRKYLLRVESAAGNS